MVAKSGCDTCGFLLQTDHQPDDSMTTTTQNLPHRAAAFLAANISKIPASRVTIGLDGFVDAIISAVDKRESADKFTRVPTLAAFGQRIANAAGASTNVELVVERIKLGGNGPIMANALATAGAKVTYIGNVGYPTVHTAFAELTQHAVVHSIAEPGYTDALEFDDGKLMLGKHAALREVTWDNLVARVGRDKLVADFTQADLVGLQNWTMLPFMSDIWQHVLDELCPLLPAEKRKTFFFDLADPEKRDHNDIRHAVDLVTKFQASFETYLGLNEKEAFAIAAVLDYPGPRDVLRVSEFIWQKLRVAGVIVHPRAFAVAASATGLVKVAGPFVEKPLISTGAGDHFNAGFCLGKLLGADNETALQLGVGTSGYYVRTAKSPTAADLVQFVQSL
jgi:sugar/nucleoside kinase (ribokinase family)